MAKDDGRSPSGRAGRATPRAGSRLGHTATIANAVGLTESQVEWISSHPPDRLHTDASFAVLSLEAEGLLTPRYDPLLKDFGHIYTKRGMRVWQVVDAARIEARRDETRSGSAGTARAGKAAQTTAPVHSQGG